MLKKIGITLGFALLSSIIWAQKTTIFTEANRAFKQGIELFDKGVYGAAQQSFQEALELLQPVNESESDLLKTQAKLYVGRCAVRRGLPDSEKIMLDFIREVAPDPASNQALIELANYYFGIKDYNKAVQFYGQIPPNGLTQEELSEVKFKMGYAYFAQKQFGLAKKNFKAIAGIQDERYYYPTHYYLGLVNFYDGKYNDAINNFKIVERDRSKKYKSVLPYYITQIYFSEGRYDDLLDYAVPKLNEGVVKKRKEMNQLIGQTYFEREQYTNALPYLERYAESSSKMREEEFYQLGIVYLENGQPQKAIKYFEELTSTDSELGQNALYNLGRLYLQVGGKKARNSARNSFGKAAQMQYDPIIQDEALFNYAKLSYELKYDRDAINALRSINTESRYYSEAQSLMSQIFLDTRDYERAIAALRSLDYLTPDLREALQKVTYYRAVQLLNDKNLEGAEEYFKTSLKDAVDPETRALAVFWLGD
ncbi:MAG: tetratricopeptide repeat protein, partial [Bacteroidota bacterium]